MFPSIIATEVILLYKQLNTVKCIGFILYTQVTAESSIYVMRFCMSQWKFETQCIPCNNEDYSHANEIF